MRIIDNLKQIPARIYILDLTAAYLFTCAVVMMTMNIPFYDIASISEIPVAEFILLIVSLFITMLILESFLEIKGLPVLISYVFYCLMAVCTKTSDVYFTVSCIAALGVLTYYLLRENLINFEWHISDKMLAALIAAEYVIVGGFTAYACVLRYLSYNSSTFDFGIFAQMYEYMAKTGFMGVSCERNIIDNHLLRHFSPIFYVLLPFYMIFRTPSFLVAIQPMIVLSGVLPLVLICRRHKLSNMATAVLASVFLCFPTLTAACYYDFHENLFLTPVILWLMYFIEYNNPKGIVIFTALTAMIKEDAGLYLCCIGLYLIFYKCRIRLGILMTAFAFTAFFITTSYINTFGDNTLSTQHYSNLIPPGERGMFSALITMALNPAYLMTQLLSADKITFLLQMFLPLMLLPFFNRRLSQQCLMLPFCAVSLITAYPYQFNIDYQYCFGTGALLVYMYVENFSLLKHKKFKRGILIITLFASLMLMLSNNIPKYNIYRDAYQNERYNIELTNEVIDAIDENASVTASTFLVPKLYKHEKLYMLDNDCIASDYIMIDKRFREEHEQAEIYYYRIGYTKILEQGYIILLKKPD